MDGSGNVTLDQIRAVVHPTTDPNEPKTLSADNLVTLTATITDKDGDSATATLNIGQNLVFLDDGPSISAPGASPTLTVDETDLATNATRELCGCVHLVVWRGWRRHDHLCAGGQCRRDGSGRHGDRRRP